MIFTHILVGALLGTGVALLYPDLLSIAVAAGFIGGGFPDLDMLFTHRRTLHFPILYSIATIALAGILLIWPMAITIGGFCFILSAAIHSLTDVLGGGKEMRPWRKTDDRAVYNHVTRTWIEPWRVFYDGSVVDLILTAVLAVVLIVVLPTQYNTIIGIILGCGIVYTALRRWITRRISDDHQTFSRYIQHKLGTVFKKK